MLRRAQLTESDPKYRPLYRSRNYDHLRRTIAKMTEMRTWFKGGESYDWYKNDWKAKLKRKGGIMARRRRGIVHNSKGEEEKKETICTMFVPPSKNSLLYEKIEAAEVNLKDMMDWNIKILEQSGIPLSTIFIQDFP